MIREISLLRKFQVESWSLPLWVVRQNTKELNYDKDLANPESEQYRELVAAFEKGIAESYAHTPLGNGFVVAEVNEVTRPSDFIKVHLPSEKKNQTKILIILLTRYFKVL